MHPVLGYERMHNGDDYKATLNTPIVATADGTIDFIGEKGDYGNYIRINHKNDLQSAYAHLNKYNKNIKNGDLIKQGEIIGYVGSSGLSTGPHLHYEIIRNGEKINPSKFAKNTSNIYLEGDDLQGFKKEYNRIIQLMKDY
jgi:murein DD-endopeptidase MepM/ murein hydrolase activator NlpD